MQDLLTENESVKSELLADAYLDLQEYLHKENILPADHSLLQKWKAWLPIAGAVQLGFLVASLTVFLNFLILNSIFHF